MNILIIGCGWLGRIVGDSLVTKGHKVFGTYRSLKSKVEIENLGITPIEIKDNSFSQNSINKYRHPDLVLIFLPAKRNKEAVEYSNTISNLVDYFTGDTRVIFTSSIGIYPKKSGVFNEDYEFIDEEKQSSLYKAETLLKAKFNSNLTILRLAGLIGPNRHPIKQLTGKSIQSSGDVYVHLVHSEDISRVVSTIIAKNSYGNTFNLVYPIKISKKDYYSFIASKYNLKLPSFGKQVEAERVISGHRIEDVLSFEYKLDIGLFNDSLEVNK